MAEIAALANVAGVICCGLKLSISLYDFAASLGAAGREIKTISTDITLFCSVLKQVQSTLGRVNAFKISPQALQTTQDILDQSSNIFDELFSIFAKLQKDENLPVDFLTRVRWTFKRAKVLLLRESLQSCTSMLHLMLTTMSFAQRIATKGTAFDDETEDEEERALTHSLYLAQQSTNERLEELEKECLAEESHRSDSALTMLANEHQHYTSYPPEDNEDTDSQVDHTPADTIPDTVTIQSGFRASKTTSLLLGKIVEQQDSAKREKRLTWASFSSQRQSVLETDRLLRNWTNQCHPLAWGDDCSEVESLLPSDSVSRYHERSYSEASVQNISTFFESATSAFDSTNVERPPLISSHSVDAADRSRRKVAKLTGEDYNSITPDWMWTSEVEIGTAGQYRVSLPPLEPLERNEAPKSRKKSKQLRWLNNRNSFTETEDMNLQIQKRLRSAGLM